MTELTPVVAPLSEREREREKLSRTLSRAHFIDRLGGWGITVSAVVVLLGVGMIMVFLIKEAAPLLMFPDRHSEGTLSRMFLPQQYDGYPKPDWVWQSEGVHEKYGVPLLVWGTMKGALWAMMFSVPLGLLAALFVSEFAPPKVRVVAKSSIEILAGIPTVIVGFVAFVVLSTILNNYYLTHTEYFTNGLWVVFLLQVATFVFAASALGGRASLVKGGPLFKAFAVLVAVAAACAIAVVCGSILERLLGTTLRPIFGVEKYASLNGLLAGFCLGFAIVPVIFSVAEDAMRAVPNSYREASLALGGSKWETALRVVVPSAAPGIYAAVMLGLARAVGETMIVLMASGNTPILDASPFTGMRTMSAAIAIEMTEKPQYSTGYHVLFFVGALLFMITFVLNLATSQLMQRLKSKYGAN